MTGENEENECVTRDRARPNIVLSTRCEWQMKKKKKNTKENKTVQFICHMTKIRQLLNTLWNGVYASHNREMRTDNQLYIYIYIYRIAFTIFSSP